MIARKRSLVKAFTWRIAGSTVTTGAVFGLTHNASMSFVVGAFDMGVKILIYYIHERLWARLEWGKDVQPKRAEGVHGIAVTHKIVDPARAETLIHVSDDGILCGTESGENEMSMEEFQGLTGKERNGMSHAFCCGCFNIGMRKMLSEGKVDLPKAPNLKDISGKKIDVGEVVESEVVDKESPSRDRWIGEIY